MSVLIGYASVVLLWNIIWAIGDKRKHENYFDRWKFTPILLYNISGIIAFIVCFIIN